MTEEDFTIETISKAEVKKLALNKDFGKLDFKDSLEHIEKLQYLFTELDELSYSSQLTPEESQEINSYKEQFVTLLNRLKNFDIGQSDSQTIHTTLTQEFVNHRNSIEKTLRPYLTFLRQQAASDSQDTVELQRLQKGAAQTKQEYETLSKQLEQQLGKLAAQQHDIASKKGEVAAEVFGKHFELSAKDFTSAAEDRWFKFGRIAFIVLMSVVVVNFITYIVIFTGSKLGWWAMQTGDFFTWEYLAVKFTLLLLLSYLIGFSAKQYNINLQLAATNSHRKNVSETMKVFYESDVDDSAKSIIIQTGTEAMFKHLPVGYVTKTESRGGEAGPVHQVINQLPNIVSTKE